MSQPRAPWLERGTLGLASLVIGLAVTGPLLAPGFVLVFDMVFVPAPPLSDALLGLSRNLPRSVPTGLLVALASRVLTGQVVQKLVLFGIFACAAYGAARLVPAERRVARVAAGILYAWNPFLYERLLLGQWTLLLGYAVLPWVAGVALGFRRGTRGAGRRLILALALAMATGPYGGMFGLAVAAAIALFPPAGVNARRAGTFMALGLAVNLPWLVPGLLHPLSPEQPSLAVEVFRARSDSPLGTLGSLLSLGGLWRTDLAPPGRHGWAWIPAFMLLLGIGAWGWSRLEAHWSRGAVRGLAALALAGVIVAIGPSLPVLQDAIEWVSRAFPGGGVLRDSQKFVIPLALLGSVAFGAGVDRIFGRLKETDRLARRAALVLPLLPVALAPTLVWGAWGRLSPVTYPPSWDRAESVLVSDPVPGAVLSLPWHSYLPVQWNEGRTVRQIAPLYLSRPVVADTALRVGRLTLPGEDPWSRLAAPEVLRQSPLRPRLPDLGVRYVMLLKEADWRSWLPRLEGLVRVFDAGDMALFRADPPTRIPVFGEPPVGPVLAGDAVTVALVLWAMLGGVAPARLGRGAAVMLRRKRLQGRKGRGGSLR